MDDALKKLWQDIRSGALDINNQDLFFGLVSKAFLYNINQRLSLRGKSIPHYILNTGDDIMYLEVKGQDHSIERPASPGQMPEVSNENFVYSQIPRCMVQPGGINIPQDQLTSPYSYGRFEVEVEDMIYQFRSEFRRIPITMSFSLKYYLDNFTDALAVAQQYASKLAFINPFEFTYLGNVIPASWQVPADLQVEYQMEFDGATTDNKYRTISIDIEVSTNIPVIYPETIIPADKYIKGFIVGPSGTVGPSGVQPAIGETVVNIGVYPKGGIQDEKQGKDVPKDYSKPYKIEIEKE